jgi:hypothetical protein
MLRPLDASEDVEPSVVAPVLEVYRRLGRFAFHASPAAKVTLVATDADLRIGSGPEVRGAAIDLLLLVANRCQVIDTLAGPGLDAIA